MRTIIITAIFVIVTMNIFSQSIPVDSMYLGQVKPGYEPKVFVLPINNALRPIERITITADGKEIYFGQLNSYPPSITKVFYYRYTENRWQGPVELFSGYVAPSLSPNDSVLITQASLNYYTAISYYSTRTVTGWTSPVQMYHFSNQSHYTQITGYNNKYTSTSYGSSQYRDISRVIISGADTSVVSIGMPVSTELDESDFFIARDESYIIHARHTSIVAGDLLISYRKTTGGWTNSKSLGSHINFPNPTWEYGPFVTHDNKYLFFTRGNNSWNSYLTYWVKIDNIIDSLKYTNYVPYVKNQIPGQTDTNGTQFSYTVPDSTFTDDDGNNTLSYTATLASGEPLPSWLNFDPVTRKFTGLVSSAADLNLKVIASDTANTSAFSTFTLSIIQQIGIEPINEIMPSEYKLYQNYPNPFNPSTNISFDVPKTAFTKLIIYNIQGREVATLVKEYLKPGSYKIDFFAENLSSGIYFYKLVSGNFILSKKMVLEK